MAFNPKEHLIQLQGKDYLEVKWRLVWFREDYPNGSIRSDIVSTHPPVIQATITSEEGKVLATGLATIPESGGNQKWARREVEKAETAAIGRALAHSGFGTQFSGDDDDTDYLPDSPVERNSSSKLADPRPTSALGTHEKPATARGATSSRPFGSVEDLAKHLIASKAQQKAKDSLISEGQAKNIGKELGILFKSDEIRAYFLWRVFQIEPDEEGRLSKYMDEKEFFTIKGWLASPLGVLEHEVGVVVSEYTSEAEEKQRG